MPKGRLLSVIGDEDTCVGFLLGGIGEINEFKESNFFVVDKETTVTEIEECFKRFCKRSDIHIVLITKKVANMIKEVMQRITHKKLIPAVVEIPSKDCPFDAAADNIIGRATQMRTSEDLGLS